MSFVGVVVGGRHDWLYGGCKICCVLCSCPVESKPRDARLHGAPTTTRRQFNQIMDSIDPAALSLRPHQTVYQHHQQLYIPQSPSPTPSSSSLAVQQQHVDTTVASTSTIQDPNLPPKPDRSKHDVIKARYRVLQNKWQDLSAVSWQCHHCLPPAAC